MLRNVRLTEDLKLGWTTEGRCRSRLVSAQDEGRRRLERNIHDGAQQQLVALAVKLKLADGLVERDTTKAHELLAQIQDETHAALEDLRDLARGIYPPLLADKGLARALEAQARKAGLPVEVRADGVGRYPQDVEAAVYFSCLEAMQNIAKYAEASSVVRDDGRARRHASGSRCPTTAAGSIRRRPTWHRAPRDRRPARRARRPVTVTSRPGSGTTIEGRSAGAAASGRWRDRPARSKKPKGLRRVERWFVGLAMGVIAFVLEKAVMRSVKRGGGSTPAPAPTTITSKGAEADLD